MGLFNLGGFLMPSFAEIWMSIWLSINDFVYAVISILYQVFDAVAKVNLFSEDVFNKLTDRIYVVVGIAMLFIFAYNLILLIINPDDKGSTGRTTKMVKEVVISSILIILLPLVFRYMGIFQVHILDSQIISKIILGDMSTNTPANCDYSGYTIYNEYEIGEASYWEKFKMGFVGLVIYLYNYQEPTEKLTAMCTEYDKLTPAAQGAYSLPITLFSAFFYPTEVTLDECEEWIETCKDDTGCSTSKIADDDKKEMCAYYVFDVKSSMYLGTIRPFNNEAEFYSAVKEDDGTFEFNGLLALVAGVLAVYMFLCYTISIGVRVAKLGFLQLISPIPVMLKIIPSQDGMFKKWKENLINTYVDVFIRLAIIYFCLFAISLVPGVLDALFTSLSSANVSWWVTALSTVVVVLGILMFAGQAPDLLKQIIPNFGSGNFSLKSPAKQISENKLAMGGINALRGGVYGATTGRGWNRVTGALKGVGTGATKGYDTAVKGIDMARTEKENGSGWRGRMIDRARMAIGMETRGESDERGANRIREKIKANQDMRSSVKNIKSIVTANIEKEDSEIKLQYNGKVGNYQELMKYSETLKAAADRAMSAQQRDELMKQYRNFVEGVRGKKKEAEKAAIDKLIKGENYRNAFKLSDIAAIREEVTKIKSERNINITSEKELGDFNNTLEVESEELSQKLSQQYSKNRNYKARAADGRWVRGNGQADKK